MSIPFSNRQFDLARAQLVELLQKKGISDEAVLNAVGSIPRHAFVQDVFKPKAYDDSALPIECQQTISQPRITSYNVCYTKLLRSTANTSATTFTDLTA